MKTMTNRLLLLVLVLVAAPVSRAQLLYPVTAAELTESVFLSGSIEPKHTQQIRTRWFCLVKRMPVKLGQFIKKGELIAEVETQYFAFRYEYLRQREKLLRTQLKQAQFEEQMVLSRQKKLKSLVAKRILAAKEIEDAEIQAIGMRIRRLKMEKEITDILKQIDEVQTQIKEANFYAPIDGVLSELIVDPKQLLGPFVAAGDSNLARIDQPGTYLIKANAVDTQVARLKVGQSGRVYLEGSTQGLPCKINQILRSDEKGKEGLVLYEVFVEFQKPGPLINRGLLARIEFPLGEPQKQLSLPWNAIRLSPSRASVIVENGDGSTSEREVELGIRSEHRVGIKKGLSAGEKVFAVLW